MIDQSVKRRIATEALPYRGTFGRRRPIELSRLPLPPEPMPGRHGLSSLKAWRYIGVYGPDLMLCLGVVRIGRARQAFWALWDRQHGQMTEATALGRGAIRLNRGTARLLESKVQLDLKLSEVPGVETVCAAGGAYAWTRKQGGVRARGLVVIAGEPRELDARAVIDDTAAYYPRHTSWRWSAGVGQAVDGRPVAWNLVSGVNDPVRRSERTVWVGEEPFEPPPCNFESDLSGVDGLRFDAEATREHHQNLLLIRSSYRQPFGTFSGELPGGLPLANGYGVMEHHDAWW